MLIRPETERDHCEVYSIAKVSFACAEHSDGSEPYYLRFGYLPAGQFGINPPFDVPAENFMAIRLSETIGPVCGVVTYAPEFGI